MNTTPIILIAVDVDEGAERAALAATALFGTDATYRFAHVAQPVPLTPPLSAMYPASAGVAPIGGARVQTSGSASDESADETIESARSVAAHVASEVGMPMAQTVGLIGHPADAIIDEAASCGADAIVVTPHDHGWIDRLFHHSISDEIQKTSPIPVIVVPSST
jgi:nucleotide-binding universal stress UspA family protein